MELVLLIKMEILLFEHILDKETVRTIFDAFNKYGMEPALFTTEGRISLLPLEEREIYTRDVFIPAIQVNSPRYEIYFR